MTEEPIHGFHAEVLDDAGFSPARTFDAVLAVTLRAHGVRRRYTRNAKNFEPLGWFEVVNPELS